MNLMEKALHDFLEETQLVVDVFTDAENKPKSKRTASKQKTEGVWVLGRTPSLLLASTSSDKACAPLKSSRDGRQYQEGEEDEADVARYHQDVELALDLLEKILHPMCTQRLTARDALYHPFLFEESSIDDDNCPHPLGEGVCSSLHFQDSVTEEHCVRIYERDGLKVQKVHSGLGIAIGNLPCVFHSNLSEQERFREIDERRIEAEEDDGNIGVHDESRGGILSRDMVRGLERKSR